MSRNKDIQFYHDTSHLPYSECRRILKEHHWDLGLALMPQYARILDDLRESLKPLHESLKIMADGIVNSLTVIDEWMANICVSEKGEES